MLAVPWLAFSPIGPAGAVQAGRTAVIAGGGLPQAAVVEPDGGIVVETATGLVGLTPQLALDPSFGEGGKVGFPPSFQASSFFEHLWLTHDQSGRILAPGSGSGVNDGTPLLARYTRVGRLDTSFGSGGVV